MLLFKEEPCSVLAKDHTGKELDRLKRICDKANRKRLFD